MPLAEEVHRQDVVSCLASRRLDRHIPLPHHRLHPMVQEEESLHERVDRLQEHGIRELAAEEDHRRHGPVARVVPEDLCRHHLGIAHHSGTGRCRSEETR